MSELSSTLPDELNFLLKGRAPGKRQVKPVSAEQAAASLAWVKDICGDDGDDDDDANVTAGSQELDAENFGDSGEDDEDEDEDNSLNDAEVIEDEDSIAENNPVVHDISDNAEEDKLLIKLPQVNRTVQISNASEDSEEKAEVPAGLGFLLKSRAPGKRKVKPVSAEKAAALADFGGSDDDDEDFSGNFDKDRGSEDDGSDDDSSNSDSDYMPDGEKQKKYLSEDSDIEIVKEESKPLPIDVDMMESASSMSSKPAVNVTELGSGAKLETLVCFVCMKKNCDDKDNELVQCDGCGIACHVLCYGIGELSDIVDDGRSSPLSTASTEPWFCDACRSTGEHPHCQLCPNLGGAFKQTESGHWVHLTCALYTGCTFGEVSALCRINVNTIKQKRWGYRVCSLCPDPQFACTGVCISCDAGMCRVFFHVTCAQREGLLAEAPVAVAASVLASAMHSPIAKLPRSHRGDYSSDEEVKKRKLREQASQEAADPFYACCKRHSNPEAVKKNKRNCLAAYRICSTFRQEDRWGLALGRDRFERKLTNAQERWLQRTEKQVRVYENAWASTLDYQSRPLTACPEALIRAMQKAKHGGVDEEQFAMSPSYSNSAAASASHYAPLSFTSRFFQYFDARNRRTEELRLQCSTSESHQSEALVEEEELKKTYEVLYQSARRLREQGDKTCAEIVEIYSTVSDLLKIYFPEATPNVPKLPSEFASSSDRKKFENELKESAGITMYECHACRQTRDQHLMMQCGTCERHFHCFCLDPPLSQPWTAGKNTSSRRTSAKWTWECYLCCPSSSDNDVVKKDINTEAPRRLRRDIKAPVRFIVSSEQETEQHLSREAAKNPQLLPKATKEVAEGRTNCYTTKKGKQAGRKRARSSAEGPSATPPVSKQGKQTTPPIKIIIPSLAALNKSPAKPADPGVYDFSSESN